MPGYYVKIILIGYVGITLLFLANISYGQVSSLLTGTSGQIQNRYADLGDGDSIAVSMIKGVEPGPVFTILAGIHGFEYPPILAVQRILKTIDPQKLKGSLIVIPLASESSFFGRSVFIHPKDGKNLNRVFPGNEEGSATERIAAFLSREIIPISDVFLDIHGGDAGEDLLPFVCYYERKDALVQLKMARKLTIAAGFEYNVVYPYTLKSNQPSEYAFKEAVQQGKTALSIEAGKLGSADVADIDLIEKGIRNMLIEMQMISGSIHTAVDQKWIFGPDYLKVPISGLFYSDIKAGDQVSKGQLLGHITNVFGEVLQEIHSEYEGIILYKIGTPPVNAGETMFCIGRIIE
ncbi:succinylglutamate desuccinylase/aspartoacylase family protein [Algoriphagus sp. AGSA1]|uniref:succinylglutamate desuccinylase/aspartoacylase family protein n=1 Tax=Algoriphagus sp. AGSA1 TaxID=2907213 RepID=UPI001F1D3713|nr:succinylglutamate desuccinylase/aspartoacylase family protein [Algoriphagus sp. AGSA1]MCE7056097.1 succinylglutamate desuccinylase/aspartoacylase family protein [Algoriphagus sp. AGSA1]